MPAPADDLSEFEDFFRSTYARILGGVVLMTGSQSTAEDVAQEAYAAAYRHWSRVRHYDRPDLWVARVARRGAIDQWRRTRRHAGAIDEEQAAPHDDRVQRLWIEWGLAALSPKQRAAVVLHHLEGRDVGEVAARMGTTVETVKTHLKRGRSALRRLLEERP